MMTQLKNDYAKGHQTFPDTVKKSQALVTTWEGKKVPVHGANGRLMFSNAVKENYGKGDVAGAGGAQESGG